MMIPFFHGRTMMHRGRTLCLLLSMISFATFLPAEDDLDDIKTMEKIKLLGGHVRSDNQIHGNPIVSVDLQGSKRFNGKYLHLLRDLSHLRTLNLNGIPITDDQLPEICGLTSLKLLQINNTQISNNGLSLLKLSLPNTAIHEDVSEQSKLIRKLEQLSGQVKRDETIPSRPVTGVELIGHRDIDEPIPVFKSFTRLSSLTLTNTIITDSQLSEICEFKKLKLLILKNTSITDDGLKLLHECESLEKLSLARTKISDTGLREVRQLKTLNELDLSDTSITDYGLKELSNLEKLEVLALRNTPVSDIGIPALAGLKNLKILSLDNTEVSDSCVNDLCAFNVMTVLRIAGTKITDEGVEELKRRLPKAKILR